METSPRPFNADQVAALAQEFASKFPTAESVTVKIEAERAIVAVHFVVHWTPRAADSEGGTAK